MQIETLGHATLVLSDGSRAPILVTDPWLVGSCYWRSWWLERYPSEAEIGRLAETRWIYITHEHPDHLHPPSLRRLGGKPELLLPDFQRCRMHDYLAEQGWRTRRLKAEEWTTLAPDVRVLSLPTWNNDSILLIDTPTALIVNLNDAKPSRIALNRLGRLKRRFGKRCILLRSYSPAAPINSYFIDGKRMTAGKQGYISAVQRACAAIDADDFIPFASQVAFHRADTEWANQYKVRFEDLEKAWCSRTRLLPPYSRVDLTCGEPARRKEFAQAGRSPPITARVAEQAAEDARAAWSAADSTLLESRLRAIRLPLQLLFPRGFTIQAGDMRLSWNAAAARFAARKDLGHFLLTVPLLPLTEALRRGHLGDLCIPMFAKIDLHGGTRQDRVNWFFMLLILQDYGYVGDWPSTLAWLGWAWKRRSALRRPLSIPRIRSA